MAIFRVNKNDTDGYTIIINKMLQDKDLSLEAKGLLSMILTLPKDWDYTVKGLAIISNEKESKISRIIKELIDRGYIIRTKLNPNETKSGRFEYIYDIYEEKTRREKQGLVEQGLVEQGIVFIPLNKINNNKINNNKINNKINNNNNNRVFKPPTLEEVQEYITSKNMKIDAKTFIDYFEANDWKDSKGNKVKSWKQKLITWNSYNSKKKTKQELNDEVLERFIKDE